MAVASPQSATRPAATRPSCLARRSSARSRHRCIIDFSFTSCMWKSSTGPQPTTLMVFNIWAANPPKVPLSLGQSSPIGEKICNPPGLPPCQISSPCVNPRRGDIAYKISCGQTHTTAVNDASHCPSALWINKFYQLLMMTNETRTR